MEIQIQEHKENTTGVIIKCRQVDNEILRLKTHIELFDNTLRAKKGSETGRSRFAMVTSFFRAAQNSVRRNI